MSAALAAEYAASLARTVPSAPVTPRSSPEDKRQYRVITLSNGLRAALVSDPVTDKASASMDVHVGHFSDPDELPGLAHFLEHMLFLGTESYPDESSYQAFLSAHGGSSNAYTSNERTSYWFDLTHKFLPEALDRFSAFFKCPLFTPSCVSRELNAVHNEHSKNLLSDTWRMYQLLESTSNPKHPMSKFGTGDLTTLRDRPAALGIDVRAALLEFHAKHYSPKIMSLAVIGRESLDELEELVRAKFGGITASPSSTNARPVFGNDAMTDAQLGRFIRAIPVKDLRSVQLLWHIDQSVQPLWAEKPLELLSHLLGHESEGSILSYLKSKHWANGLSSGVKMGASSFTLFSVSVDLTEEGLEHSEEVVEAVQSYITHVLQRSLREEPSRWESEIFREVASVNAMNFIFKSKESPHGLVGSLSHALQVYPPERVLDGPYELPRYNGDLVRYFVDEVLTDSKRVRVHLVSQKLRKQVEETEGKTFAKEKWYGTEHLDEPLPASLAARLANPAVIPALHLPKPNEFIATEFGIKHPQYTEEEIEAKKEYAPLRIPVAELDGPAAAASKESAAASVAANGSAVPSGFIPLSAHPLSSVWWKADRTFGLPKSNLLLRFRTPRVYDSPSSSLLANLYAQLVSDALNEFAYHAQIASLNYKSVAPLLFPPFPALPLFFFSRLPDVFVSIVRLAALTVAS
jgi:insulysin